MSEAMTTITQKDLVCIGAFAGAHGVRGRVKVKSFTQEPGDFFSFERIFSEDGSTEYRFLTASSNGKGLFISQVEGIETRDHAEALKSTKFYALKSDMPDLEDEDEFYYSDLIGLEVRVGDGTVLGEVKAVSELWCWRCPRGRPQRLLRYRRSTLLQ